MHLSTNGRVGKYSNAGYTSHSLCRRSSRSPKMLSILLVYIYIYLYPFVRTSRPKSSTCLFFYDISIFLRRKCYKHFFFSGISIFRNLCMYTMRHGIALSAMDSSTLNSSAMDSSAIGVQCRCCCTCR